MSSKIRVDFFKQTGKWYTTEELSLTEDSPVGGWKVEGGVESFERFLGTRLHHFIEGEHRIRYGGMIAVTLDWGGVPVLGEVPKLVF